MASPVQVGNKTEAVVLERLMSLGWNVLLPFGGGHPYDLVAECNGKFVRVQRKTGTKRHGSISFPRSMKRSRGNAKAERYEGAIDYFAVYCKIDGQVYFVPISCPACYLRLEATKNGQQKNIFWARDFLEFVPL